MARFWKESDKVLDLVFEAGTGAHRLTKDMV